MNALVQEAGAKVPDAEFAASIAARVTGSAAPAPRRFATGARHYVFDIEFADRPPVVVRIGRASAAAEMAGAVYLSALLRPRGVPLPAILAANTAADPPWLVLERLPGDDLGAVISHLTAERLDRIAARVARAQAITAQTGSAGGYGYAVRSEGAPHAAWSHVLEANLARSRRRITAAGLVDPGLVDVVEAEVGARREEIDAIAATPFLHDTTTRNVIVTEAGSFSGIVDVDDLCFGDPRFPAALTLAVLLAYGGPASYVTAWLRHARHADDHVFRTYVSLFLLDLMSEHGQVFSGNEGPSNVDRRNARSSAILTLFGDASQRRQRKRETDARHFHLRPSRLRKADRRARTGQTHKDGSLPQSYDCRCGRVSVPLRLGGFRTTPRAVLAGRLRGSGTRRPLPDFHLDPRVYR